MINLVGKFVTWEKLNGKSEYNIKTGETGSGVLSVLDIDHRMYISGDYGISTSRVMSILMTREENQNGIEIVTKVETKNSTYLVKEQK